jgi:hypothetical protein
MNTNKVIIEDDDTNYSNCCGAEMPDWPDSDFCPQCKEHSEPFEEGKDL